MIQINKQPGQKVLEIGGGDRRHTASDVNIDVRKTDGVDFAVDLNTPNWPISSDEFDLVFSHFCLEHISWRVVPIALKEIYRVTKPGGKTLHIVPNTEAQMKHILSKPEFDGDEGSMIFGSLDYPENSHRAAFSPKWVTKLFSEAGFTNVLIRPYSANPRTPPGDETDMSIEATKPLESPEIVLVLHPALHNTKQDGGLVLGKNTSATFSTSAEESYLLSPPNTSTAQPQNTNETVLEAPQTVKPTIPPSNIPEAVLGGFSMPPTDPKQTAYAAMSSEDRAKCFSREYFDIGGGCVPGQMFYLDFPTNELVFRHVMARRPESVLDLGCGRGYILKRFQDAGIESTGIDISKHCQLTRVCENILEQDVISYLPIGHYWDFIFSLCFWEYIPEDHIKTVADMLVSRAKSTPRGLHGISFKSNGDPHQITIRPKEWWQERLPAGYEVWDADELRTGPLPVEYLRGDGKTKLNLGCAFTQFHNGWKNIDCIDAKGFAQQFQYDFLHHDLRNGVPFKTGEVDLIYLSHCLEHFTYAEGLSLLKECRRVMKKTGALRVIVPDGNLLTELFVRDCRKRDGTFIGGNHGTVENEGLACFDDVNGNCADSPTAAGKLYSILHENHLSLYDMETLEHQLKEAGFLPIVSSFRGDHKDRPALMQMARETLDTLPSLSLYCSALPV